MIGAGTVINPLIKIITTVVILGAVYLFIVKPALDTTNNAFDSFSDSFNGFEDLSDNTRSEIKQSIQGLDAENVNVPALQDCITHAINAGGNQNRIDRCLNRFGP
jgi:hypothetical protein